MKKIGFIIILTLCSAATIVAQEKGSYLTVEGGFGPSGLKYDLKGISSDGVNRLKLGANALVGYSYFFTPHWGVGTGVGISYYNTRGRFSQDSYFNLGEQIADNMGTINNYELRVRLANWKEKQSAYFFDIPVMLQYQYKFGERQRWGLYAGAGVKFHIPLKAKFKVLDADYPSDGRLNVSGLFYSSNIDYGAPDNFSIPYHSFGTIHNPHEALGWEGDVDLKMSISGIADFGFLFGLSPRVDLTAGAFIDYGFNNIKKGDSKALLEAPENYLPAANNSIGNGIIYNGMVNSDRVDKVHLLSYGLKIGVRIKLGKLHNKEKFYTPVEALAARDSCCCPKNIELKTDNLEKLIKTLVDSLANNQPKSTNAIVGGLVPVASGEDCLTPEEESIMFERVYFDLNKSVLHPEGKELLDKIADVMKNNKQLNLKIFGNTCDLANDNINIPLGMRRANACKKYLVEKGVTSNRIATYTQSEYDPYEPNTDEAHRKKNRSAEFIVFK